MGILVRVRFGCVICRAGQELRQLSFFSGTVSWVESDCLLTEMLGYTCLRKGSDLRTEVHANLIPGCNQMLCSDCSDGEEGRYHGTTDTSCTRWINLGKWMS